MKMNLSDFPAKLHAKTGFSPEVLPKCGASATACGNPRVAPTTIGSFWALLASSSSNPARLLTTRWRFGVEAVSADLLAGFPSFAGGCFGGC
jgi:hypothetical protein